MSATVAIYHQRPRCNRVSDLGVDWLTGTQVHGEYGDHLWALAGDLIEKERVLGNDVKERPWQGYRLEQCGQAARGTRRDGLIIRLSGTLAAESALHLLPFCRNVSRLDLQVSGRFHPAQPLLAREAFKKIPYTVAYRGRPSACLLVASAKGGDTLYRGSRASEAYGRYYDKGVESGQEEPGVLWRWELELKGSMAWSAAVALVGQERPLAWISNTVYSQWRRWGMEPGFPVL